MSMLLLAIEMSNALHVKFGITTQESVRVHETIPFSSYNSIQAYYRHLSSVMLD